MTTEEQTLKTLLTMVSGTIGQIHRSPGLSRAPFSLEGWQALERVLERARAGVLRVAKSDQNLQLARPEEQLADTKRLEWLFEVLNDEEIKRRVMAVSDVHAIGSIHGIRMRDWRHALDVAKQQYVAPSNGDSETATRSKA